MKFDSSVFIALGLNKKELGDKLNSFIKKKNIENQVCVDCGSNECNSNGYRINSKGKKIHRYICKGCKKTFYRMDEHKLYANYYLPNIKKSREDFLYVITMCLRIEYEKEIAKRSRVNDEESKIALHELSKISKRTTIDDISREISINRRTVIRWKKKIKSDIEYLVNTYSDREFNNNVWYDILKVANRGYNVRAGNVTEEKKVFDNSLFWLIAFVEDGKDNN